jgi:glycosyltransferase involved in cell wall biosynthesis
MKVLMLGIPGLLSKSGGDRIQIEQTAKELRAVGAQITIAEGIGHNYDTYDLVHVFQLDWNPYCYFQIKHARRAGKPVVFSPIHHNINELKRFDNEFVFDFRRISKLLFANQFHRDLFKEFYRSIFNPTAMWIVIYSALIGLDKMYAKALKLCDVVLVQTEAEAKDLRRTFNVDFTWRIVKNGVSPHFHTLDSHGDSPIGLRDYLLCVGRIEPRKNQTNIIYAVKQLRKETKLDLRLVLIGSRSSNKHFEYYRLFDKLLNQNEWITHIPFVAYEDIPKYYQHAKVGISASWFETTGLTSLEALFCGANAVASGERAKEYLNDYAFYCDPGNVGSIKNAILKAYQAPRPTITDQMREEYTWRQAAFATMDVYRKLVNMN